MDRQEQSPETKSGFTFPAGSCDCHCHVFGPPSQFPYPEDRRYTPPEGATFDDLMAMRRKIGLDRAIIVQGTTYETDNSAAAAAIARNRDNARGIAVIDENSTSDELEKLSKAGFLGTRVGLTTSYGPNLGSLESVASRLAEINWHMQFTMDVALLTEMGRRLEALPVDLVFDHIGCSNPATGIDEPGFQRVLALLREGRCWMKLSGPYKTSASGAPDYEDLLGRIHALVEANPDRVLWASNWPHMSSHHPIDDRQIADLVPRWLPSAELREAVLVRNPEVLYGFKTVTEAA